MFRRSLNKHRSSRSFNHATSRTKRLNIAPPPMRGGFRL